MQPLDALIAEARLLATGTTPRGTDPGPSEDRALSPGSAPRPARTAFERPLDAAQAEVSRVLQICNACRYCEGFCAVFPAMTRRLEFGKADVNYLANLCHNCGACLHACQYAPPHEFAVNVPRAMAVVRRDTPAMALLLAVHLGAVMALFLTLPYGKFAHGVFRLAALLKWAVEKRQPSRLQLGAD